MKKKKKINITLRWKFLPSDFRDTGPRFINEYRWTVWNCTQSGDGIVKPRDGLAFRTAVLSYKA